MRRFFKSNQRCFPEKPTDFQFHKKLSIRFKVNIWDVGGQRTLRPFWRNYYEQTDSLIWVVDATALDRLEDCRVELHKVLTEDRLAGASLLILVNKMDAVGESPEEQSKVIDRVQTALQLDEISGNKHKTQVLGCSAYKGTNLETAIDWVVNEVKSRMFQTVGDD